MSVTSSALYTVTYDLSNCDEEPLHLIRSYQAAAVLLATDTAVTTILAASDNVPEQWARNAGDLIGKPVSDVLPAEIIDRIRSVDEGSETKQALLEVPSLRGGRFTHGANLLVRTSGDLLLLEFEPMEDSISSSAFLLKMDRALQKIQSITDEKALYARVTKEVQDLTGFDRVMLYRFDEDYNGEIVGESRRDYLPDYLNLRYPHTDIPRQAREMYFVNPLRQITSTRPEDVVSLHYHPELGQLDLTMADGRGPSPFHIKYLSNMDVGATMSLAIMVNQKLWGLIACHHMSPRLIDARLRSMLGFMVRVMSGHLALWQTTSFRNRVLQTGILRARLFERMNDGYDIKEGLLEDPGDLLALTGATGCVIVLDGQQYAAGATPTTGEMDVILEWLRGQPNYHYHTDNLLAELPAARDFRSSPAGLLSIRLTEAPGEYVIWFRPEIISTVDWGGNPETRKQVIAGKVQLHPEISFAKYTETVTGRSTEWLIHQRDAALTLRNDIKEVILQKFKQVQALNGQLTSAYEELEGFSYTVSHDLRAPLRTIRGFAEILQEDYADKLDEDGANVIETIVSSVGRMSQFINDILAFSKVGNNILSVSDIDLEELTTEIWRDQTADLKDTPPIHTDLQAKQITADPTLMRQIFGNLLGNAIKYQAEGRKLMVVVRSYLEGEDTVMEVEDNGIGFSMEYADRIFGVFNRLVSEDEYAGTGIGLAIVKRALDKHNGNISVRSELGKGTTFTLRIPAQQTTEE